MNREIEGQREFLKVLWGHLVRRGLDPVILRHVDMFTKGHPDTSVTANSKTIWFEFKRWDGLLSASQEENAKKMGNMWVIIFLETGEVRLNNLALTLRYELKNYIDAALHFVTYF